MSLEARKTKKNDKKFKKQLIYKKNAETCDTKKLKINL